MNDEWAQMVEELQMSGTKQGDRVMVDAPDDSYAKPFNGEQGAIEAFVGGWVHVRLDLEGGIVRLRADEVKVL